jgi:hypothetical protein
MAYKLLIIAPGYFFDQTTHAQTVCLTGVVTDTLSEACSQAQVYCQTLPSVVEVQIQNTSTLVIEAYYRGGMSNQEYIGQHLNSRLDSPISTALH